jgi:hypothetical protein
VSDLGPLDRALEGEVEIIERLHLGEAGTLDPRLTAMALARGHLSLAAILLHMCCTAKTNYKNRDAVKGP